MGRSVNFMICCIFLDIRLDISNDLQIISESLGVHVCHFAIDLLGGSVLMNKNTELDPADTKQIHSDNFWKMMEKVDGK